MATITRDDTRITRELWTAIRTGQPGATVSATNTGLPSSGYFVGGESYAQVRHSSKITPDDVAAYVSAHPSVDLFGMWVDGGVVYLDAVTHVPNGFSAASLGRERGEKSIYNVTSGSCEALI